MSVLVECRCGTTFEIDVMEISGQWWRRCPNCEPATDDEAPDVDANEEEQSNDGD